MPHGPRIRARFCPAPQSFVLADRLAFCRFSYLEPRSQAPFRIWRPDWVQLQQLPLGIRIEMAPLDATPADLHVADHNRPANRESAAGGNYSDAE